jgi:haloalkane dehalogenase
MTARNSARIAEEISAEFPFESGSVEMLGSNMHYVEAGRGPVALFVHGNPTWSYLWRNVIPHVARVARCVAVDLIGMGLSDKPQIDYKFADHARYFEAVIDALGLEEVTLVLHDWRSALGFDWASRHEPRVSRIAFMEAFLMPVSGFEVFPESVRDGFKAFRTPELGWELLVEQNQFIERVLPSSVVRPLSAEELDNYRRPFRNVSDRMPLWRWPNEIPIGGEPAEVHAVMDRYSRWLQRTAVPKLMLHAEPGVLIGAQMVEWAQTHLPELTSRSIGEGIHDVQEDQPHLIGRAIADWLEVRSTAA